MVIHTEFLPSTVLFPYHNAVFVYWLQVNCSPYLKFFLCTMYVPVCTVLDEAIPPCRSLCMEARNGCEVLMNRFGFQWPENLECSRFPESGLCVGENRSASDPHMVTTTQQSMRKDGARMLPGHSTLPTRQHDELKMPLHCPNAYTVSVSWGYQLHIGRTPVENCGMPCSGDDAMFSGRGYTYVRYVVLIAAIACLVSTLFTVLTFLVDMHRFRYPERPIIFLSACYSVVAITYIVGYAAGQQIACTKDDQSPATVEDDAEIVIGRSIDKKFVVVQGTKHEVCTILFILLYFFSMASSVWWVILTVTWFLSAGLKWGNEAIESNSHYFHLAAWAVPAVKTIAVLATSSVDGDGLTGVCWTGVSNIVAHRGFVLAPLCAYLAVGTCFLLAGFVALCRIRTVMKHDGTRTDKLEKLMVRIGIFGVLYMVPAAVVISCYAYEHWFRGEWMVSWLGTVCKNKDDPVPCPPPNFGGNEWARPNINVFMIKYLMTLIVGITSGFWIWSGKTIASWSNFYSRICGRRNTRRVVV